MIYIETVGLGGIYLTPCLTSTFRLFYDGGDKIVSSSLGDRNIEEFVEIPELVTGLYGIDTVCRRNGENLSISNLIDEYEEYVENVLKERRK